MPAIPSGAGNGTYLMVCLIANDDSSVFFLSIGTTCFSVSLGTFISLDSENDLTNF